MGEALADRLDALVIGTSAGGVEALMTLLPALPETLAIPVFIVVHLPRSRSSSLAGIFRHSCVVHVVEAEDKQGIAPGTVYLAPPDYHLLVDKGPSIALSIDDLVNYSRPSIDVLFESAADCYGPRLAGVVLTGANSDGAVGLAAVARRRGLCIVQDPVGAVASAMPAAAIQRVPDSRVLPLAEIATLFGTLGRRPAESAR